jgi:hypothetical protein
MDIDFARKVSADHYVFCGNGEHGNPELDVIDIIYNLRLGKQSARAPEAKDRSRLRSDEKQQRRSSLGLVSFETAEV